MTYHTNCFKICLQGHAKKVFCIDDLINFISTTQCYQRQAKIKQLALGAFIAKKLQEFKFSLI